MVFQPKTIENFENVQRKILIIFTKCIKLTLHFPAIPEVEILKN